MAPSEIILYTRPGCHLCDDARELLAALLARRAAEGLASPLLVERDIEADPAWESAFFATIPVVEIDGRRLELATSGTKLERFLVEALDA